MRKLDPDDARPPYLQLVDSLRSAIDAGDYQPGEKLPSYETLAAEFEVSLGVVKRAMTQLRADRVVVSRQGQGAYVHSGHGGIDSAIPTLTALQDGLDKVNERLAAIEQRLSELG